MLNNLHIIYKIRTSSRINSFLYFLKRLPVLKKKLKNTNYSFLKIKGALGIISIIYNLISGFVKALLVFLLIYLPSVFIMDDKSHLAIGTFIFIFYFVMKIFESTLISYELNKFILVKQMKMKPRDYSLAMSFPGKVLDFLAKAIVLSIFLDFKPYPFYGVILAASIFGFSLFSEALHLFLYKKYDFAISRYNVLLVIIYFFIFLGTYALALLSPINLFSQIIINPVFLVSTVILGGFGASYIYKYDDYGRAINESNNIEHIREVFKSVENMQQGNVKLRDKDFKVKDLQNNKFSHKEGYNYLNSIFFDRHKRIVYKPMIIKSLVVMGIFVAFIIFTSFFYKGIRFTVGQEIFKRYNILVFVMYILCNSERLIKSMFYNCDLFLLRYGFYKKGNALLKMFFLRLIRIFYSNLIPTTVLALGLTFIITSFTFYNFIDVLPIILLLYVLAMFFSVHYIFMYYIFQPFTSSMKVKNPFYSIINFIVYFVSYMLIQIPAPPTVFLPIIIGLLLLYVGVSVVLVYKRAPQTFRIK